MEPINKARALFERFAQNESFDGLLLLEVNGSSESYDESSDAYGGGNDSRTTLMFKSVLAIVYSTILIVGLSGNLLVCYVVIRNKHMRNVTNYFIINLGLADIMLCTLAGPITALDFLLKDWVFGEVLCHLIPCSLGVSVYLSVLTLMSIAIDRYFVILYPFRPRMKEVTCLMAIGFMWILSVLLTLPYGICMDYKPPNELSGRTFCYEAWPDEQHRKLFTSATAVLQFVVPFIVTAFCYICVWYRLRDRSKHKLGRKSVEQEELDRKRNRRMNRMLIAMVLIFGASWLPLNLHHIMVDFNENYANWGYVNMLFFTMHGVAMSSACYNPFLYAWLNENFRKEFKLVLPRLFPKNLSVKTSIRTNHGNNNNNNNRHPGASESTGLSGPERSCQRPLLAPPQCASLTESKGNGNRREKEYFSGNLISTCEVQL